MKRIVLLLLAMLMTIGCASRTVRSDDPAPWLYASDNPRAGNTLRAIDRAREVVRENLAHADTTGFKRSTAIRGADGQLQIALDMTQGSTASTGRPFDLAISGPGFFRVRNADRKVCYTRNGNLFVDNNNQLVLGVGDGLPLDPPVAVPPNTTEINVSESGAVQALVTGQLAKQTIGQIVLYQFRSPDQMSVVRGALLAQTDHSGEPVECTPGEEGAVKLLQGYLESSNVQIEIERQRLAFLNRWREAMVGSR